MRFFTAFKQCRNVSYTSRVDDVKQLKDFIFPADSLENIQRLVEKAGNTSYSCLLHAIANSASWNNGAPVGANGGLRNSAIHESMGRFLKASLRLFSICVFLRNFGRTTRYTIGHLAPYISFLTADVLNQRNTMDAKDNAKCTNTDL